MKECDILYKDVFFLTDIIRNKILIEAEDTDLPEKAFIFFSRYQEQFVFFNADGLEPEPSIFYYYIDNEEVEIIGESIFSVLESEVEYTSEIKKYSLKQK